jgi:hypothetical protein
VLLIWRKGELISRSRFMRAISAGDERYFIGDDNGGARPCDEAASFCSWAAAGSGVELGIAFRCDVRLGVEL